MTCGVLSIVILLAGCFKTVREARLAPADGIVRINGKPAANILVQFLPDVKPGEPGPTSTGVSNEAGEFELKTADGKLGAVIGRCKVLFVDMAEERVPQGVPQSNPPRVPSTATIIGPRTPEVEVKTENRRFEFDLTN